VKDFASSGFDVDKYRENKNTNINSVECPEVVVRKEEPMDIEYVINELQNKLFN